MNNWLTEDHLIYLPNLFEHLGYQVVQSEHTHHILRYGSEHYVIINTEKGYLYYKVQRPQEKLSASDLITEYVSKVEGIGKELIWDKVDGLYNKVLETETLLIANNPVDKLKIVPEDFNHFLLYRSPLEDTSKDMYQGVQSSIPFSGRVFQNHEGGPLFSLVQSAE